MKCPASVQKLSYVLCSWIFPLLKRWSPPGIKKLVWEREFEQGKWLHPDHMKRPLICEWIEKYCGGGVLLDLGCSDGIIGLTVEEGCYKSYTGVDISDIAIEKATIECKRYFPRRMEKNQFVTRDIAKYIPSVKADVVLFRESLYYFNHVQARKILAKYRQFLVEDGVFIVVMGDIKRHQWIVDHIEAHYRIIEKSLLGDTIILIFN